MSLFIIKLNHIGQARINKMNIYSLQQLPIPASGMPDVVFEQQALKFVAERLFKPVSSHLQHPFDIDKSGKFCVTQVGRSK